jgi:methyl-accepting chemotaxis protein
MSENQGQAQAPRVVFRERITAIVGVAIVAVFCILVLVAAISAVVGDVDSASFQYLKDLLTFWSGLAGSVTGYYFGREAVERRAEAAESTVQAAQEIQLETRNQLNVEKLAHDATKAAQNLAEQAQEKAEQIAEEAEEAWKEAETKVEQGKVVVGQLTNTLSNARDHFNIFKEGLSQVGTGVSEMFGGLGEDEEGAAPPLMDPAKLDTMISEMDAALQTAEQWQS